MYPAENSWMSMPSSSSLIDEYEYNQEALYYMSNNPSYLSSLFDRLTLSNNNNLYQGNIALSNQNNVQTYVPNYAMNLFPTRERFVPPVIRPQAPALYHQYPSVDSISNNGGSGYNFQRPSTHHAHTLYPNIQDRYCGGYVNSRPYNRTQLLLNCINSNPYLVMINPETCCDFLSILDACKKNKNKKLLNVLIENMAEFPAEVLVEASCHMYGCRVIKKLITVAKKVPSISLLPWVFASKIVVMTNDPFGWPVVETCLSSLDKLKSGPLYEELVKHCLKIATGKFGCIAIQKFFEIMNLSPLQPCYRQDTAEAYFPRELLIKAITNHAALLAQDHYGNFVLQFVIETYPDNCLEPIAVALKPLYEILCTSENGSYLVEKVLVTPCRSHVAQALLESNRLVMLAQDEYGNYTIQTLLKETKAHRVDDYQKLCKKLSLELSTLESSLFGKNVGRLLKNGCKDEDNEGEIRKRPKEVIRRRNATFVEKKAHEGGCSSWGAPKEFCKPC